MRVHLYIVQDFIGVKERLSAELAGNRTVMVPPMVTIQVPSWERNFYLLNVGGLSNPYLSHQTIIQFAQLCGLATSGYSTFPWHRLGNALVSEGAKSYGFHTVSPGEAAGLLSGCRVAVLTGGLGNIFDVASFRSIPAVFLPPFNDSQGQQLRLLKDRGLLDAWVDWQDIGFDPIDYWADQPSVNSMIGSRQLLLTELPPLFSP